MSQTFHRWWYVMSWTELTCKLQKSCDIMWIMNYVKNGMQRKLSKKKYENFENSRKKR